MAVDTAGQATAGTSLMDTHRKPWGAGERSGRSSHGVESLLTHRRCQHSPCLCMLLVRTLWLRGAFMNTVLSLTLLWLRPWGRL